MSRHIDLRIGGANEGTDWQLSVDGQGRQPVEYLRETHERPHRLVTSILLPMADHLAPRGLATAKLDTQVPQFAAVRLRARRRRFQAQLMRRRRLTEPATLAAERESGAVGISRGDPRKRVADCTCRYSATLCDFLLGRFVDPSHLD